MRVGCTYCHEVPVLKAHVGTNTQIVPPRHREGNNLPNRPHRHFVHFVYGTLQILQVRFELHRE